MRAGATVVVLAGLLAACGGGGSSSDEVSPTPTVERSATPVTERSTTPTVVASTTPTVEPTRSATAPPTAAVTPTASVTGIATHTATAVVVSTATESQTPTSTTTRIAVPTPRGDLVVPASEFQGVVDQLPNGLIVGGAPTMPAQYRVVAPGEVRVEDYLTGLVVPWALAFSADGRLFITERPGRVRVARDGVLDPVPWAEPEVRAVGEGGLMGLALHPDFPAEPWVYVCYTFDSAGEIRNRITRIREVGGRGADEEPLLGDFPGASIHDGCRLKFGPDGKLYATTGDAARRTEAQSPASLLGKILRLNPDGSIPPDNPFGPDSPIWSYGHRNPQGLAFDPLTGKLFATEHGPSGEVGIGRHDEVNVIEPGVNYGWPIVIGAPGDPRFRDPLLAYPQGAVPPAGCVFYSADLIPEWKNDFFFTSLGATHLQRVVLDASRTRVLAIEHLFDFGRLRDVVEGPDGALYVTTSNRDGRGTPRAGDDRVLRVVPAGGTE